MKNTKHQKKSPARLRQPKKAKVCTYVHALTDIDMYVVIPLCSGLSVKQLLYMSHLFLNHRV